MRPSHDGEGNGPPFEETRFAKPACARMRRYGREAPTPKADVPWQNGVGADMLSGGPQNPPDRL